MRSDAWAIRLGRISRFAVAGGSSALVNLVALHLLVSGLGWQGGWHEDAANLLALEISTLCQFTLCRCWVWRGETSRPLWSALFAFHAAVAMTSGGRVVLFSLLRLAGLHYLPNALIGIGLAALFNYLLYDRLVFRDRPQPASR